MAETTETTEATERTNAQVQDAYELASYVVENGITDKDGDQLSVADIAVIESTAGLLGIIDVKSDGATMTPAPLTSAQWNAFEQAYYRLAIATKPVTAETLRNTRYVAGADSKAAKTGVFTVSGLIDRLKGYAPAQTFTRMLWAITALVVLVLAVTEVRINDLGMNADVSKIKIERDFWQWLQPWAYGALGACAYLLRSGHYYIRARSFDLRRKPEYFNRILLGAISGGAIILFADYLLSQEGAPSHIGTTTLGFIAGYSTDFLFNTVERVVTAFFPKVSVETVLRDQSPKKTAKSPGAGGGAGGQGGQNAKGGGDGAG